MNLCIVNEDHPRCNVPRKAIKACPGRGQGPLALSLTYRMAMHSLFLHGTSVVHVNCLLQPQHTDPAGQGPHHLGKHIPSFSTAYTQGDLVVSQKMGRQACSYSTHNLSTQARYFIFRPHLFHLKSRNHTAHLIEL